MEYKSSPENFRNFIKSSIWEDLKMEIHIWLEQIAGALEDPGGEETVESTERLRGSAKALRRVLGAPEAILQNIIDDQEAEKRAEEISNGD